MSNNTNSNGNSSDKNFIAYNRSGRGHRGMPVVKAKNFTGTFKRLLSYIGEELNKIIFILILVIISGLIALAVPYLIGLSIDVMSGKNNLVNLGTLKIIVVIMILGYFIDSIIKFVQGYVMAGVSQRIVKKLRSTLSNKLQKLPISYFDRHTHGEIMSRLSNDIENVSITISQSIIQLMTGTITIGGSFIMMITLSPLLTVASLVTIPLVFTVTKVISKRTKVLFKEQQKEIGRLNGYIEEIISGSLVVKAFNHEDKSIEMFDEINDNLCDVGIKAQVWSGFIMPLMNVINNIGFASVAGIGGILAVNNYITVGIIASFLSYSRQFARPLNDFASTFNTLQSAIASAERVFEVLDEKEEIEDLLIAKELKNPKGNVIFEDVTFGYNDNIPVLKNVSFNVNEGASIALVGPTGAGKTTIVNLLSRFYEITSGRILIDGIDIREYKRDSLRKCFGIVLQDTYLFSGTIKENIKYGKPTATDKEVETAAKMANADLFIKRLPNGYNTFILESGANLSQGQRQLIAISRAILSDPSILILDEATSNVDTRTELHIQEAMLKLMNGRTSFVIAHRLSTIRDADTIMVIDDGKIIENGNHYSLIEKKGIYHNLYFSQFKNISGNL